MTVTARTVTDEILDLLDDGGLTVGDGDKNAGAEDAGWQADPGHSVFEPYAVLHPVQGGMTGGSISRPNEDGELLYQVTGVGGNRAQAELVGDLARSALADASFDTATHTCWVTVDFLGGARRDDTVQPPVWITTDRFRVIATPLTAGS